MYATLGGGLKIYINTSMSIQIDKNLFLSQICLVNSPVTINP